jgi:trk system potassium uptake protein TrkA
VHVVIVGCGRVGSALALQPDERRPHRRHHRQAAEAFARLGSGFTGQAIAGIGFDRDRLIEAGIERAGALAAVTSGDNSNIMIARVARETFGVERVVARIYDPRGPPSTSASASPPSPPWRGPRSGCCGASCPTSPAVEWVDPSASVMLVERVGAGAWAGHR